MAFFKIGFTAETQKKQPDVPTRPLPCLPHPVPSVVKVFFSGRNVAYSYYNDAFDLKAGDLVYVEGKLEGIPGRVTEVNRNFKIRLSDYKRVLAVIDTEVHGTFFTAGSHMVTFDRNALPYDQAFSWFKAPQDEAEEDYAHGQDETSFMLGNWQDAGFDPAVAERGHSYYMDNKVRYLTLNGNRGKAIVEGREIYEVEFSFSGGEIRGLTCSCFCSGKCKHEFAVLLQLQDLLKDIEEHYGSRYEESGYFAAITRSVFFSYALDAKEKRSLTL